MRKLTGLRGQPAFSRLVENLTGRSVEFGVPSFNEGSGVTETLASLNHAADQIGLPDRRILLSDSSDTTDTVDAARAWAEGVGADLYVDRSYHRRSLKEALNNLFSLAQADLLILVNADVVVPTSGLAHLLFDLTDPPTPQIAVGFAGPDPSLRAMRYRASAWQRNVTRRIASDLPRDAIRSEGAFWGARRSFYSSYRFPIGSGSIHDDVELARHAQRHRVPIRNSWRAEVYKVPAGNLKDFYIQTHRGYAAAGEVTRGLRDVRAAAMETLVDPLGAVAYLLSRAWAASRARRRPDTFEERWLVADSTKRRR